MNLRTCTRAPPRFSHLIFFLVGLEISRSTSQREEPGQYGQFCPYCKLEFSELSSAGSTTLGIPFSVVKGFLVYGGLASYLSFSLAYGGSLSVAVIFTGVLFITYGGICYLLATLFHDRWINKAVDEVRKLGAAKGIPLKSMSVT